MARSSFLTEVLIAMGSCLENRRNEKEILVSVHGLILNRMNVQQRTVRSTVISLVTSWRQGASVQEWECRSGNGRSGSQG
jgi:hypothetical protein